MSKVFKDERSTLNATISFKEFQRIMFMEFDKNRPDDVLLECMFERFKPLKFDRDGKELESGRQEMHVLDFLIAMNLLSRVVYDKKMKMIFELCDDDDDGCMRPAEILYML